MGRALLGSAAVGATGLNEGAPGEDNRPRGRRAFPAVGLGFALALPRLAPKPKKAEASAYIQYRLYDESKHFLRNEVLTIPATGDAWQPYQLTAAVPTKGYIQVTLGNAAATPVWFDDLQATAVQQQRQPAT